MKAKSLLARSEGVNEWIGESDWSLAVESPRLVHDCKYCRPLRRSGACAADNEEVRESQESGVDENSSVDRCVIGDVGGGPRRKAQAALVRRGGEEEAR